MPISSHYRQGPTLYVDDYNRRVGINTEPRHDFHVDGDIVHSGPTPFVDVRAYNALGDGATDDTAAIQAAINSLPEAGGVVFFPPKTYVVNGTLSIKDKQNVRLLGSGAGHNFIWDSATPTAGTVLKRVSGTGVLIDMGTTSALATSVGGCGIESMTLDGNSLATTVLLVTSVQGGTFRDLHIRNGTSVCMDWTTVSLSGIEDSQYNLLENITIRQAVLNGIGARFDSGTDGIGNFSLSTLINVRIVHRDGVGMQFLDTDDNAVISSNVHSTGTGIGVELGGSNHASSGHARHNVFLNLQCPTGGLTARSTGFSMPSADNLVLGHSRGNSSPSATIEDGAGLYVVETTGLELGIRPNPRREYFMKDDLISGTNSSFAIGDLGWGFGASTSGVVSRVSSEADHPGIFRLASGATASSTPFLSLSSNGTLNVLPAEMFDMTWVIRLNVNDANTRARFGIADFANSDPATNGIYVEKLAADTQWFGVCRASSSQTRTGALASCDTSFHRFRIRRKNSTTIGFTIDDGTEATVTANIPSAVLMIFMHITNNAAAADKTIDLDYFDLLVTGLNR